MAERHFQPARSMPRLGEPREHHTIKRIAVTMAGTFGILLAVIAAFRPEMMTMPKSGNLIVGFGP